MKSMDNYRKIPEKGLTSIPDLQVNPLAINLQIFHLKINADRRLLVRIEFIVCEADQ